MIVDALASVSEPVVLATVVRITGSSYGGVGARMVIRTDGSTIGIVSGGCLESDLAEHALQAGRSHAPRIVTYDTRADDDAAWGLGLGCNGLIDVLLEPLEIDEAKAFAALLSRALDAPARSVLATVIASEGPPAVGAHALFVDGEIETAGDWSAGLLALVGADTRDAFGEARRGLVREYEGVSVAFEVVAPSIRLVICGSGPDVVPLVQFGVQLGWDLTVIDHRPVQDAHAERFPGARAAECGEPSELESAITVDEHTAAVVMSHNYARDLDYVRALLHSRAAYIGVLGPRARTERMLADIAAAGARVERGDRIYSPVGLDVGGDGPDFIAMAIIAEVSATIHARGGGHLRDRRASLHPSPAHEAAEQT
jgi:xanthine/CO dehydrogenase XdhC/CoxF family maturation factor